MDNSNFENHDRKIDTDNFIEYKAPTRAKYTPPSPTTSGYSESGSENHDSGRVSEMESSPKINPRRPNNIALSMGVFNPGEGQRSPEPFSEGRSTIRSNSSNAAIAKSFSGDYALPLDAFRENQGRSPEKNAPNQGKTVLVNAEVLRTLVVCLKNAQNRLDHVEGKVEGLIRAAQLQQKQSTVAATKLTKTILALGNDFNRFTGSQPSENGRVPKYFQSHPGNVNPHKVPVSNNNNNIACSECAPHSTFHPYETVPSQTIDVPSRTPPISASKTATFPRIPQESNDHRANVPKAPPSVHDDEYYDNMPQEQIATDDQLTDRNSGYVNGDVTSMSRDVLTNDPPSKYPLYAVVRKDRKSTRDGVEGPSPTPSDDVMNDMTSHNNDVTLRDNQYDLDKMLEEMAMANNPDECPPIPDDVTNTYGSLTRVSRFSDMESLMSFLDNSTSINDMSNMFEEQRLSVLTEDFDNKVANGHPDTAREPRDGSPESRATTLTYDQSSNELKLEGASAPLESEKRDNFSEPRAYNGHNWHQLEHEVTYARDTTNVERVTVVEPSSKKTISLQGCSLDSLKDCKKSNSSLDSEASRTKAKKKGKRTNQAKISDEKKSNLLVTNVNRLFKRKNKPKAKRSVSQNSFTFVVSPLHDNSGTNKSSPESIRRNKSADSVLSSQANPPSTEPTVSSLSNLTSSQEGSLDFEALKVEEPPTSDILISQEGSSENTSSENSPKKEDNHSIGEFDNIPPLRVTGAAEHVYENSPGEEMRPNFTKVAKKVFRSSSRLQKKKSYDGSARNSDDVMPNKDQTYIHYDVTDVNFDDDVFLKPGVILDRQQHEQAERHRFETDRTRADEPPPKPTRPGFGQGARTGANAHGASNGTVPGPGMYPRGMPAVPPKKIMTPEELTNHEAHEKLRLKQMEEAMIQQKLEEQQKKAEEDALWLQQEEQMLNPDGSSANGDDSASRRGRGSSNSLSDMQAPPPPSVAPSKPPRKPKDEPSGPPQTKIQLEEVKTAPTMQLNRENDIVYKDTMEVVKSVLSMNNMTMNARPEELFNSVKGVGAALKQLCTSLENTLPSLPEDFHREIDMAQKTTNKDLSQVINQLKLVQRFFATTQVVDYKKCLMAANQVLAIDAKNLLDVVDRARIRKIQNAKEAQGASGRDNFHSGEGS